jgi:hypothetical protein
MKKKHSHYQQEENRGVAQHRSIGLKPNWKFMKVAQYLQTILLTIVCLSWSVNTQAEVGEDFTIGAYYSMPSLEPKDNFSWDYAFMDMARIGCNRIVLGGNCWNDGWAALKHWDMKVITSYGQLNAYPGEGKWKPEDHEANIRLVKKERDLLVWNGEYLGDTLIGHIMADEPECEGLTEDKKNFLRTWADTYHRINPERVVIVNHCDPPWYDLNEKHATCSAAPTIRANGFRITNRIKAAQEIGLENFTTVALMGNITQWAANMCDRIEYFELGPCSQEVFDWLAMRSNYQDAYEELLTAYYFGSLGFHPYIYNQHRGYSLVDKDGNDQYGIRNGFCDAAHDLRMTQGWPSVELFHNEVAFQDRGRYAAGSFVLTAQVEENSVSIAKVIFGKTTDGGATWESLEDNDAPYSATFSVETDKTVIFRAQAVDTDGRKSIFSANMINTNADKPRKGE